MKVDAIKQNKALGIQCDFELIYGESRLRAVSTLGTKTIPAIVRKLDDIRARRIRLDENLVRNDLNPLEEVNGLIEVAADELGVNPQAIVSIMDAVANAENRGKELKCDIALQVEKLQQVLDYYKKGTIRGFRAKYWKLAKLPEDIKKAVQENLSWTKAVEIAPIKDDEERKNILAWAVKTNPSIKAIREKRKEIREKGKDAKTASTNDKSPKARLFRSLKYIKKSAAWTSPENQQRIEDVLSEIQDIFQIDLSS